MQSNSVPAAFLVIAAFACTPARNDVPPRQPGVSNIDCAHDPIVFPTFDRACASNADCALDFHRTDCCGGQAADGIRATEKARFASAKATCDEQWLTRNCPSCVVRPATSIEDGQSSMVDEKIAVECRAGRCTSVLTP